MRSSALTSELLGLAATGVGNKQRLVVLEKKFCEVVPPPRTRIRMLRFWKRAWPKSITGSHTFILIEIGSITFRDFPLMRIFPLPAEHTATAVEFFFLPKVCTYFNSSILYFCFVRYSVLSNKLNNNPGRSCPMGATQTLTSEASWCSRG